MPSFLWSSVTTSTPFLLLLASEKHTVVKQKMEFKCKWFLNGDFCCNVVVESVMSDSLQRHRLQHARLPCLSPSPGAFESVMPSNRLVLCPSLLLLPSFFPSIRVCLMSWLFISGGQIIGTSPSVSVLLMNIQD